MFDENCLFSYLSLSLYISNLSGVLPFQRQKQNHTKYQEAITKKKKKNALLTIWNMKLEEGDHLLMSTALCAHNSFFCHSFRALQDDKINILY